MPELGAYQQESRYCLESLTMSAAYAMEPGVTAFILFNIACGRFILGLLLAVSSCVADDGAVNICL